MPFDVPSKTQKRMMGKTPMVPSKGAAFVPSRGQASHTSLSGAEMVAGAAVASFAHQQQLVPREDEPNLYNFPSNLSPIYRPMSYWLEFLISSTSLAVVGRRIISSLIQGLQLEWTVRKVLMVLFRYILLWSVARVAIQESFFPPSRVTTQYLADTNSLPSVLSRYETILPVNYQQSSDPSIPICVHSLQYTSKNTSHKYAAIQFHHGFGASSLSWLPILPSLTERLGAKVGLAHDVPGFGFTDRPNADTVDGLRQYRSENSVGIGMSLLLDEIGNNLDGVGDESDEKKVAIFGHSMGTKAALLTALAYSDGRTAIYPSLVVLVAPALEGVTMPVRSRKKSQAEIPKKVSGVRKWLASFWIVWRKVFVDWPFSYILRRLVGTKNFWRKGLSQAWGDPKRLSDSDVLRFQWPSIGKGWERGLISFARAVQSSDDADLLRRVASLPDTSVVIVYGTKDNVVRVKEKALDKLKLDFPTVKVIKLEGLGHDPFEEDVGTFLTELEKVLQ